MPTDKNINKRFGSHARGKTRRRRTQADSRENILDAAEVILTSRGPLALKLTEVAAKAGVAPATVLHHFSAIDGVQSALMERMVARLAARVIAITKDAPPDAPPGPETDIALFDAFEDPGAARLAAWMVMTGQALGLTEVKRAIDSVVDLVLSRLAHPPAREIVEDLAITSVAIALGAGLFGQPLGILLGRPPESVRHRSLAALAALNAEALG
jgi:AcrR family transcriptional regulator